MVSQSTSSTVSLNSDCVKLNTLTLPPSSSSTGTSASLRSFNCSSGNTASNLDCTIGNDANSFSGKGKHKNNVSTFFSLRFPNDLSNGEKGRLMKNAFVTKSNFVFPITKIHFVTSGWVYIHGLLIPKFVMGHIVFSACFPASCYRKEKVGAPHLF